MHWNCLIWVFSSRNFETTIPTFEISSLELVKMPYFSQNKETWNLDPKIPYLLIFRQELEKPTVILKWAPLNLSKCKVLHKINNTNSIIWDQKCLIWVFRQEFEKTIAIVYFKSALSNLSKCNVSCETKETSNLRPKVHYLESKFLIWVFLGCNFEILLL